MSQEIEARSSTGRPGGASARREDIEAAHAALCDPTTGLAGLALLVDRIACTVGRSLRANESFAVIAYRVASEDPVGLTCFGEALEASVDDTATVARPAPDVFAVVTEMPGTTEEVERHMVDLLHQANDPHDPLTVMPAGVLCCGDVSAPVVVACALDRTWQLDLDAPVGVLFGSDRHDEREAAPGSRTRVPRDVVTEVHYQPVVRPESGEEVGAEALLRVWDGNGRPIETAGFIARAEQTGAIIDLGARVLHAAASAAVRWPSDRWVSVNVSPIQLAVPAFEPLVLHLLERTGLAPHRLVLEITERAVLAPGGIALRNVHRLATQGVRFALDDFGTGFSSIERLRHLPVHHIKIDKSIIDDVCVIGSGGIAVVRSILGIGEALAMSVIAEGVETELQRETLTHLGLDLCQGHLFGPATARVLGARVH